MHREMAVRMVWFGWIYEAIYLDQINVASSVIAPFFLKSARKPKNCYAISMKV